MRRYQTLLAAASIAALTTGCTNTLDVEPISAAGPRTGVGYVLPYTQYGMTLTWGLDSCPERGTAGGPKIALKVEAVQGSADDGNLAFMVNPQDLQSLTAVTSFTAKWHDGSNMLSTINASAEDRSAAIVGSLVKTAVKLLPLVVGAPPLPAAPGAEAPPPPPPPDCTDAARTALKAAKTAKGALETRTEAVNAATAELERLTAKAAVMGDAIDEGTKKALADAMDALSEARAAQSDAADALAAALKPITYVRKFDWPTRGDEFDGGPWALPAESLARWVTGDYEASPVYLQIERVGTFGRAPGEPYTLPAATERGLRYRMPAAGRLVACKSRPCRSTDVGSVLASFDGPVVQLGYVNVLPFRGRAFGNNSFAAEFGTDGSLRTVGYEQKSAPAEVIAAAGADAAEQIGGALDPTARLQSESAYLKALKEKRDAYEALKAKVEDPVAAQTASLGADTALINAQLANLEAQIALEERRAKTPH